ncbi:putative ribonuclease H-like domain-containing protein [Tanacetum coccineum]
MPSHSATPNWQTPIPSHPHDAGLLNPNILNRERREVRASMYRQTPYMDLPPTTVLPKKHDDKTNNKVKNANVSPLNLGNTFADDNVGGDDVMFLGVQYTGKYLVYENVDPSKVMREDYIDCMEFLLNLYDVYLDCHMMGYLVPDYFWRQLVPHLCMAGSHSLERPNQEGWLSGDVYMPINAGGNHWVTSAAGHRNPVRIKRLQDVLRVTAAQNGNSFKPAAKTTTNADGTSTTLIPGPVATKEKIVEQEFKGTASSSSSLNSQNMAFVLSPSSTNEVNTAYRVSTSNTQVSPASTQDSTASTQVSNANLSNDTVYVFLASQPNGSQLVYKDLEQIHEDDIEEMDLKCQLALLSMRRRRFFQKTGRKITINGSNTAGYDKSKVECFNCHKMGHFARTVNVEETSSKAMLAIDGAGFDWSYMVDDEVLTNMALMVFSDSELHNDKTCSKTCLKSFETLKTQLDDLRIEFNKSEFNLANYKRGLAFVEEQLVFYKKNELEKLKQEKESNQLKIEKFDNDSKSLDKLIGSQIPDKSRKGIGFVSYNAVPPPPTWLFSPPNLDLSNSGLKEFQQPEFEGYGPKTSKNASEDTSNEANFNYHQRKRVLSGNNYTRVNYNYSTKKAHPSAHRNMAPRAVLIKTGIRPLNTARPVNTSHPKTTVYSARPMSRFSKSAQSTGTCPISQTLRNLMEDMLPLREEPKEGKLLVKELLILMCDKKNNVLFTNSTCFVLSPDFKLVDESQVLLKVPRKNNKFTWVFFLASKDETSGILKSFITEIENLVDKKQNGVAERRNRTLIEAARTMLADSKLPTTFWAEAVNTACYVQNRVLVVKPHNKTPYELFRGRTPALSFIRPFGYHVTIINTLDYLGKFDGKSDEGFFVGYSLNSKAFRVYNIRTRKVEENLHIRFLEDKPIIAGDGPKWLFDIDVLTKSMNYVPVVVGTNSNDFVGTEESVGTGHSSKETGSSQDYILMSLDAGKKDDKGVSQESGIDDQERPENSTQDVNTAGPSINTASTIINTGSLNNNTVNPTVTTALLEATHADFFGDETELDMSNITTTYLVPSTPNTRIHKDHSLDHVIGDVQSGVQTRRMTKTLNERGFIGAVYEGKTHEDLHTCLFACFLSQVEPKKVIQALTDLSWIEAMQVELLQFKLQKVWTLVDLPYVKRAIGTKWVYRNKNDERGFEDPKFPDRVYNVEKPLYGLHQAPRAWYETLSTYLLDNGFQRGQIDKTLFIKKVKGDILLVQVYVDDIIFGFTRNEMCIEFEKMMHKKFQMSSVGELTFFLRLQVTQKDDGIFISQDKYVDEILNKFYFSTVETASTPMETSKPLLKDAEAEDVDVHLYRSMIRSLMYLTSSRPDIMFVVCACARFQVIPKVSHLHVVKRIFKYLKGQPKLGLWYPKDSPFDLEAYIDNDYAGASLDRKSTIRGCQFLGSRLILWQCKKQTIVANSTTEAEYVAAASCCGQVLWIQNQMLDYGYNFINTKIFIDNESTICIVKNLMFHSKTKHIKIRHHFIRDLNEKKLFQMIKIHTDQNVANLLTKAFDVGRFQYLIACIGMLNL